MPQQRELSRLLEDHQRVQARIGAGVSAQALAAWSRVSPTSLTASATAWLASILTVIRQERTRSREAAASVYRLHRALETGYTLPPLADEGASDSVTLGELREDWAQYTDAPHVERPDDGEAVQVEEIEWPEEDTTGQDAAAQTSLVVTGPVRAHQGIGRVSGGDQRGRLDDADFLEELESVMGDAGTSSAGAADREALRGGRDLLRDASRADPRVIGWARVTDGDPCSWCAMLAGRGAVYRSREIAGIPGRTGRGIAPVEDPEDLQKYHDQCHCQTVPVYSRTAFLPDASARYAQDWRRVTQGLAGAEARSAWRRHIDSQRRERRRPA
ncbi:VG15 protein [Streptomyces nigrescens]